MSEIASWLSRSPGAEGVGLTSLPEVVDEWEGAQGIRPVVGGVLAAPLKRLVLRLALRL